MKYILSFLLLLGSAYCMAQETINPASFKVEVNYMNPRKFPSKTLDYGYKVELRNDSAIVHLPYIGEVYMPSMDNDGLNYAHPYKNLSVKQNKKGTATMISFSVKHGIVNYNFHITASKGGHADIDVIPSNAQSCSYNGDWENVESEAASTDVLLTENKSDDKPFTILYMGDSVTDGGWGNSGGQATPSEKRNHWDKNHIYGHSYMMLCASQLESDYPTRNYNMLNRGISGDDIQRMKARWEQDAIGCKPDVMSMLEGTNDVLYYLDSLSNKQITHPFDLDAWEKCYRELLTKSKEANPGLNLVLCTPFVAKVGNVGSRSDFQLRDSLLSCMAERIRVMANDYKATLVDYNKMFAQLCNDSSKASHWIWDGIHPTPAGHRRMADLWLKEVGTKVTK